jgi:NTE family protein
VAGRGHVKRQKSDARSTSIVTTTRERDTTDNRRMAADGNGVALVLAGGGARGAYEIGALSVLLPALERRGERPEVIVGTSVGAINSAFLAATAGLPVADSLAQARELWSELTWDEALRPLLSPAELAKLGSFLLPGGHVWGLLEPEPLAKTLRTLRLARIHANVASGALRAAAVVATSVQSSSSVVFHDGGGRIEEDAERAIAYEQTRLRESHVLASAAIPSVFPAVRIETPRSRAGWYYDGGTRLNTPIKPALELGGRRVIVVALNSLRSAHMRGRPQVLDGATQIVQALLVDPLVHDVQTLASINEILRSRASSPTRTRTRASARPRTRSTLAAKHEPVPYIVIAPRTPNEIGEAASRVYSEHYAGVTRAASSVGILGRVLGAGSSASRGELFSYVFFAREFALELMARGESDARRWLSRKHDDGPWRLGRP